MPNIFFPAEKCLSNLINSVHSSKSPTKLHCEQKRGKVKRYRGMKEQQQLTQEQRHQQFDFLCS